MSKRSNYAQGGKICTGEEEDQLPELISIISEAAEAAARAAGAAGAVGAAVEAGAAEAAVEAGAAPDFSPLIELLKTYKNSGKTPGLVENIKKTIRDQILKNDVKALISPVLISLFGGPPTTEQNRREHLLVSNCILDALMEDFSLLDYVKLVGKMYLKSYYDDNIFRVGVATAFTVSGIYLAWNSGIGAIAGLSRDGCIYLMSVLGNLVELVNNQELLNNALNAISIPPDYASEITIFIQQLRDNIAHPSTIKFMIAAGMVALMERLHPEFRPLDGMRAEAAAAAGAGAVPAVPAAAVPPAPAAPAAAPAAAGAGAPAPAATNPLLNQLLEPLRQGGNIAVETFHKYLSRLLNLLHKIAFIRVGVVVPEQDRYAERLSGYICRHIGDYLTRIENQAETAHQIPASYLNAKLTIDALLGTPQLLNMTASQSKSHILRLASTIRKTVLDYLKNEELLERICPMFRSALIEENLKILEMGSQRIMLEEYFSQKITDSLQGQASQDSISARDATLDPDIAKIIEQGRNFYLTIDEKNEQKQIDEGLLSKAESLFWNAPGRLYHTFMRLAETGKVCGFVSFSKELIERGKDLFDKGSQPSPSTANRLPQVVGTNPVSAPYIPIAEMFNDATKFVLSDESILETGITEEIKNKICENFIEEFNKKPEYKNLNNNKKLSNNDEANALLNKMYDAFKFDKSQRMGRPGGGVAQPAFLNKRAILFINPAATSGVAVEVVGGSPTLVRTLRGCNPPSLTSQVTRPVKSIWKIVETAANVICKKLEPSEGPDKKQQKLSREDENKQREDLECKKEEEDAVVEVLADAVVADAILDGIEKGSAVGVEGSADLDQGSADLGEESAELGKERDGGSRRRRKSRKNVKKTTRRNKKIVRKSSKNTKQHRGRSSRRHRSSRKSRK